jgi:hypothetical protein
LSRNSKLRVTRSSTVDCGAKRSLSALDTVTVWSLTMRPSSSMRTLQVQPSAFGVGVTLMALVTAQLWAWILALMGVVL